MHISNDLAVQPTFAGNKKHTNEQTRILFTCIIS